MIWFHLIYLFILLVLTVALVSITLSNIASAFESVPHRNKITKTGMSILMILEILVPLLWAIYIVFELYI